MKNSPTLNLELEKLLGKIKGNEKILIQLPDGLKPKAKQIQEEVKKKYLSARLTFWAGSCYGSCDVPNVSGFDLLVQFGHSEWR